MKLTNQLENKLEMKDASKATLENALKELKL